jgi:shikimate dehydrogenase
MREYALIGKSLVHSFSPAYFKAKFEAEGIHDASYEAKELQSLNDLPNWLLLNPNIAGFNVTIPFKREICAFIDELFGPAAGLQVVNTVVVERDVPAFEGQKIPGLKLKGFNTDIFGFKESIKPLMRPWFERALILGTGASASSVAYVLYKLGIDTLFVSRNPSGEQEIAWEDVNEHVMHFHPLIINTSPIGQFPDIESFPPLLYEGITPQHLVYDLIYNPQETALLKMAKAQGAMTHNGEAMLRMQADQSWKTWENALKNAS